MNADEHESAARALDEAERERAPIPPLTATYPGMTLADAYAIQEQWVALKIARGNRLKGHKIGLTSRAMQRLTDFNEPDYGALLEDMLYEDGSVLPSSRFITPMLECELAFFLKNPLEGPDVTIFDVLEAASYVVPAVEIVDLRTLPATADGAKKRTVLDNIADNAANAALVLGGQPVRPDSIDLQRVAAVCRRNLIIEESGVSAAVLNHPARGIEWLAKKLALHGRGLGAGQIVLGGSFTRVVEARPGDQFHVDFGPLGAVTCSFQ